MYNSEELNTQQVALQRIDEAYTNACIYDVNANNIKLYSCVLPPLNFYQWNDLGESTHQVEIIHFKILF